MNSLPPPAAMPDAKRPLLEKDVEKAVVDFARRQGFWSRKFVSPQNRGAPDRIFKILGADVFFIEFKRPGKAAKFPSDGHEHRQKREHDRIREQGGEVHVIDDVKTGKALLRVIQARAEMAVAISDLRDGGTV